MSDANTFGERVARACWAIVDDQWAFSGPAALTNDNLVPLFAAAATTAARDYIRGLPAATAPRPTTTAPAAAPAATIAFDPAASGKRRVIPPRPEWVSAYSASIGYRLDVLTFLDFYESKGWLVGKAKMKDWQAAVRTWRTRNPGDTTEASVRRDYTRI